MVKTHHIVVEAPGGPEVLQWREVELAPPGPGEVLVKHNLIGFNYNDITKRGARGQNPPLYPFIPGSEAVGVIEAIGEGASFNVGERVYYTALGGAYAERRLIDQRSLLRVPDLLDDEVVIGGAVKAGTAICYLTDYHPVSAGSTVLVLAAAGAVATMLCQLLHLHGAIVIGTASSAEKAEIARSNGCDYVIIYTQEDFVERVSEITGGRGVDIAFDAVGKDTFLRTLLCLRPRGMAVSCGHASGKAPLIDMQTMLMPRGLAVSRPEATPYINTAAPNSRIRDFFELAVKGDLKVRLNHKYALRDVVQLHRDVEDRKCGGAIAIVP